MGRRSTALLPHRMYPGEENMADTHEKPRIDYLEHLEKETERPETSSLILKGSGERQCYFGIEPGEAPT